MVGFYDGKKHGSGGRKAGRKDSSLSKGMPDLMRQFGTIVRQVIFLNHISRGKKKKKNPTNALIYVVLACWHG